jgi:hypothetical protein
MAKGLKKLQEKTVNLWIILTGEIQDAASQTKTHAVCRSEPPIQTKLHGAVFEKLIGPQKIQEMHRILWNPGVYCGIHKRSPTILMLGQVRGLYGPYPAV